MAIISHTEVFQTSIKANSINRLGSHSNWPKRQSIRTLDIIQLIIVNRIRIIDEIRPK